MSILLDAVSRSKQQHETEFDPISSPRPLYSAPVSNRLPGKRLLLPGALALAVATAWGVNHWLMSGQMTPYAKPAATPPITQMAAVQTSSVQPASVQAAQVRPSVTSQTTVQQTDTSTAQAGFAADGVRLAGKSALPAPVSLAPATNYTATANAGSGLEDPNAGLSFEMAEETAETRAARLEALMAGGVTDDQRRAFDEVMQVEESRPRQVLTQRQTATPPREQGVAALQAEVDKAAAELGLHRVEPVAPARSQTQKQVEPLSGDALVQAFEAALKEVEFTESINQDVTPEPLSTIPSNSDYPRYGDLPAGLQLMVPEFNIMAHVYSNDPAQRWLNVDGTELQEGDSIQGKLRIVEIRPRDVVLDIDGTAFKVPAI
ncbi:general secretion pathway protein GspB [Shewanella sp.]|uniref:general secretion pathway protein GspB n=1 Tax=Shewanella sp. TaxID=50422 RepID=UPI0035683D7E